MAELSLQERLQPVLLDRLTDDEPMKQVESREQRVVTLTKLRASVLRDLSWLLNTTHMAATTDLAHYPDAALSVLNYGLPSFAGTSIAQLGVSRTEDAIREAILRFEPRLVPNSIKVKVTEDAMREDAHNTIALEIEAELWFQPVPLRIFMKTELDLEIGMARVTELTESQLAENRKRRR